MKNRFSMEDSNMKMIFGFFAVNAWCGLGAFSFATQFHGLFLVVAVVAGFEAYWFTKLTLGLFMTSDQPMLKF